MRRTTLQAAGLLAVIAFFPLKAGSQTLSTSATLSGNNEIGLEQFEWFSMPGKETSDLAVRITLHNKTQQRSVRLTRFTIVAKDKRGTTLMQNGAALQRLVSTDTIAPGTSGTIFFPKACTIPGAEHLELKEVYVEFNNGSLSVLKER